MIGEIKIKNLIHSSAIVSKSAILGNNVAIAPYAIIEENVMIGDNTTIGTNAHIKPYTTIGKECRIFNGAVLGEIPQDLKFKGEEWQTRIK